MNTETDTRTRAQRAAAWVRDSALSAVAILLVLIVACSGWSASFISLHQFAEQHMHYSSGPAWLVPGTFDGAALGLSVLAFRAATFGRASFGARVYVYGFTALSSWINYIHIDDPQGRLVACLLPISAVVVFDKVLREAREAYERRHGKAVFRVRPGLLVLRLVVDRAATASAIRGQITAIPVQALIGLGAGELARDAAAVIAGEVNGDVVSVDPSEVNSGVESTPALASARISASGNAVDSASVDASSGRAIRIPAQAGPTVDEFVDEDPDLSADVDDDPETEPVDPAQDTDADGWLPAELKVPLLRLETDKAAEVIAQGWREGWSVTNTAAAATRDKGYVSRQFTRLSREAGHTTVANGS